MIRTILRTLLVCVAFLACANGPQRRTIPESTPEKERPDIPGLELVARKTVDSISSRDAAFLSSVVDDRGITLGTDGPMISAPDFRAQLGRSRGAYCDLFGCGNFDSGVREILRRGVPYVIKVHLSSDIPNTGLAEILPAGPRKSAILTLVFVVRDGQWRLRQIEYI